MRMLTATPKLENALQVEESHARIEYHRSIPEWWNLRGMERGSDVFVFRPPRDVTGMGAKTAWVHRWPWTKENHALRVNSNDPHPLPSHC
jgi:hypothetical protein